MRWAIVAALVGAAAVAAVVASAGSDGEPAARQPAPPAPSRSAPARAAPDGPQRSIVLVRRRGGVPPRWVNRLRRARSVAALAVVSRTQVLMRRSLAANGRVVDRAPSGYAIPLDALAVDPRAYAEVITGADRRAAARLRSGRVLLSRAAARLRRLGTGGRLATLGRSPLRVAGVVGDASARSAELVVAAADVPRSARRNPQVLLATTDPRAVARAVPDDRLTRVAVTDAAAGSDVPGAVIRPVDVKRRFGEFAVRLPYGRDWITIDRRWVRRTIATRRVPILGAVTCHRAMFRPLRRALGALQRRGLARLVDPGDFAGCYAPRRIPASGNLSLHAWGLAIDLNASANPQGERPRQDRRLVRIFERAGFTWGGRWPTAPDGMHFELHGDR
jgi:D-alanyl-D-alanine carboxypeptidase